MVFYRCGGRSCIIRESKNKKDVGKATFLGFIISLFICVLVSVLPFGVLSQEKLSVIPTPSTSGILKILTGDWGEYVINIGVLVSVLTSWLAWTMICAEIPMVAAENKTFPQEFAKKNKNGAASVSLWVSSGFMQLIILLVYFSNHAWLAMLAISALTVLPAYLMSTAYLLKLCITGEYNKYTRNHPAPALITALIGVVFCLFMFYASEVKYLVMVPILLTIGLPLFILSRIQDKTSDIIFLNYEKKIFIVLIMLDIFIVFLLLNGVISF
ncbi:amino acid permease [Providencia hangzhouensis]